MKKIVSITLAFSFLVMSMTGMMLYIVPKGKVAYWANWKMFGLTKTQYGDIHITSMILFTVMAVWHIYYNWKPLTSYIKNTARQITLLKKELLIALSINLFFVAGTLMGIQPLQTVLDINENIKTYWEDQYGSPPYGHAEESSLESFAQRMGVSIEKATKSLKENGITVTNNSQTLLQIAEQNSISPKIIYDAIKSKSNAGAQNASTVSDVSFLGRRTLQELATMKKINLEKSLAFLKEKAFNATPQSRMREAANALGTTPYTLYKQLKVLK